MKGGTNLRRVGDYNRQLVLETIRLNRVVSRVQIARQTGLTPQTITNIVRKLMDEELVQETDGLDGKGTSRERTVGKPRVGLGLNTTARHAFGVHIDRHETRVTLLDLAGGVTGHRVCKPDIASGPARLVERVVEAMESLAGDTGVDPASIVGVGAAAPGPLDPEKGEVLGPPGMPGWQRVPLGRMLADRTGLEAALESDAVASAVGERWAGRARGARNFMFVYMGWGMGAGLFVDGQVYRGSSGTAGEIAHIPVHPTGPACWCGKRGCLARVCGSSAVVEAISGRSPDSLLGATPRRPFGSAKDDPADDHLHAGIEPGDAFARACRRAAAGDQVASEELERAGARLGATLAGLVDLLDLELVVLGGSALEEARAVYLPAVSGAVQNTTLWRDRREVGVVASSIGRGVGAVGAAAVVLHKHFAPQTSGLELFSVP